MNGEKCEVCGTNRLSQTRDGFLVCQYGHQSQKHWSEEHDAESFQLGNRLRSGKRGSGGKGVKRDPAEEEYNEFYNAKVARIGDFKKYYYILGVQSVLMVQVRKIIELLGFERKGLGALFEAAVRSRWFSFISNVSLDYREEINNEHEQDVVEAEVEGETDEKKEKDQILREILEEEEQEEQQEEDVLQTAVLDKNLSSKEVKVNLQCTLPILFLTLIEFNVPIILADLRRFIHDGLLPYGGSLPLIPPSIRKTIQRQYLTRAFLTLSTPPPPIDSLRRLTQSILHFNSVTVSSINVTALIERFLTELSLPLAFTPLIINLLDLFKINPSWIEINSPYTPDMLIISGIIFFLKLHYQLDTRNDVPSPSEQLFIQWNLPSLTDLVSVWSERKLTWLPFNTGNVKMNILQRPIVYWRDVPDILEYAGLTRNSKNTFNAADSTSMEQPRVFPLIKCDWHNQVTLTDEQLSQLSIAPKRWSLPPEDPQQDNKLDHLYPAYRLLLMLAAEVVQCDPERLLQCILVNYEAQDL